MAWDRIPFLKKRHQAAQQSLAYEDEYSRERQPQFNPENLAARQMATEQEGDWELVSETDSTGAGKTDKTMATDKSPRGDSEAAGHKPKKPVAGRGKGAAAAAAARPPPEHRPAAAAHHAGPYLTEAAVARHNAAQNHNSIEQWVESYCGGGGGGAAPRHGRRGVRSVSRVGLRSHAGSKISEDSVGRDLVPVPSDDTVRRDIAGVGGNFHETPCFPQTFDLALDLNDYA